MAKAVIAAAYGRGPDRSYIGGCSNGGRHTFVAAARYADHLVAMAQGQVIAAGDPGDVLTEETVRRVFGLDSRVVPDPLTGRPMVIPIGRHHTVAEPEQAQTVSHG